MYNTQNIKIHIFMIINTINNNSNNCDNTLNNKYN